MLDDSISLVLVSFVPEEFESTGESINRPRCKAISFKKYDRGPFLGLGIRVVCSIRISGVLL